MKSRTSTGPVVLTHLSIDLGIDLANWQLDAIRLAAGVQQRRRDSRKADRDGVTRSVLLWAICAVSGPIGAVMATAGLDLRVYEHLLNGFDGSQAEASDVSECAIVVEPELADAFGTAPDFVDSRGLVLLGGFEAGIDCLKLDRR